MTQQHLLILDFESYYDDVYSLRKMTPAEYILDHRFEVSMMAAKLDDGPHEIIDGPDIPAYLSKIDPAVTTTVTFNALFDNCILSYIYDFVPVRMVDALGIARTMLAHKLPRLSLAKVAEYLKIGHKGHAIANVKGMRRDQIRNDPVLWGAFSDYCLQDNRLCEGVFRILGQNFPPAERRVMDLVLRCAVEPKFIIDRPMLVSHLEELKLEKAKLLTDAGLSDRNLVMSNSQFQKALEDFGVDVEMKTSPITGKLLPAFAKTDEFMAELSEHEDSRVQALAAARLGHKSTIEETRGMTLLRVASLRWRNLTPFSMPIPIRFGGTHTHRLSGDWKMNMQNMPSGRGPQKSKLRNSLRAPPGHKVIVADLGQIEARISALICGADVLLRAFTNNEDPYKLLAMAIFGVLLERVSSLQRFIGKSGVLGLGYGAGPPKFYIMVIRMARALGMDVRELKKVWTLDLAKKSVSVYRNVNYPIVHTWRKLENVLDTAWLGLSAPVTCGPCVIGHGFVRGPNGLMMQYAEPKRENDGGLTYTYGGRKHTMYGSKFLENIVQFLARIVVMNVALRLSDRGYRFALQSHDELAFIVPDEDVDNAKQIIHTEMTRRPSWAPSLPLKADVGSGQTYGDAK
jgi:DNA polymerase